MFDFKSSFDKKQIQDSLLGIPYVGKGTATGDALNTARVELLLPEQSLVGRRDSVKTVVLVVRWRCRLHAHYADCVLCWFVCNSSAIVHSNGLL